MRVSRLTVDTSEYPDLVVVYLGMRVRRLRGLLTVFGLGPKIRTTRQQEPDGLLLHEDLLWSLIPMHVGMRQYWRDLDSLEAWTRSEPHQKWWRTFLRDTGGTGFWHEAYFMRGGIDAIYDDIAPATGIARFATTTPARGAMFSGRQRSGDASQPPADPVLDESELYSDVV
jgi:hypothetical protein